MFGLKQNTSTSGREAKETSKPPRRTAIIKTFACRTCGKKYFYKILRCPMCESTSIGALQDVVIIP